MDPTKVNLAESAPNAQSFNIEDIYSINVQKVELPSRGVFYKNHKSSVTLKGYTTIEENMMTDESLARSGKLLDKLLESVVLDKDVDWDNMLVADKLALIVAMRRQNEGDIFKTTITCPFCQVNQPHDIDLSVVQIQELGAERINGENLFEFETPMGHTIRFRMLVNGDLRDAKEEKRSDEKNKIVMVGGENIYLMLREMIAFKPAGQTEWLENRTFIKQIIQRMPKDELKAYRDYVNKIEPKLDASFELKCVTPTCEANLNPLVMPIPLNSINFFRPIR